MDPSRRALVVGGAVALGSVAAATAALVRHGSSGPSSTPTPRASSESPPPTAQVLPTDPARIASLRPTTSAARMQQVERTAADELFITQSVGGTARDLYTTIVSRYAVPSDPAASSPELDAMTILDGGHGLGLHVEPRAGGGSEIWLSLQGEVSQGHPDGGRLARFAYSPGIHTIDGIPGGVTYLPRFRNRYGRFQESIYNFDWAKGLAVERMYNSSTWRDEQYTRRRIRDIVRGVDRPLGRMTVPVDPPTLQGFTTVGGSLYRWLGVSNAGSGAAVEDDPMVLEQLDWASGKRIATTPFPTLGQDGAGAWRDGAYEPEGCSVHRGPDGTPSLVVGVTVGGAGDHAWPIYGLPLAS